MHCGLLGRKLSHSLSPDIHAAFGYDYSLFEVEPQNLASFFAEKNFHGINVTIPYKQDVIPFCDELSPVAREIGSVNTILRRADGSLFGDNTDAEGFAKMLNFDYDGGGRETFLKKSFSPPAPPSLQKTLIKNLAKRGFCEGTGRPPVGGLLAHASRVEGSLTPHGGLEAKPPRSFGKVVIIGGGGSSLSVKYVMERLGAETVIVVSRGDNHAEFLRQHSDAEILVNCTPVGMYPNVGASPVSLDFFPKLRGVFDLIYNPARTELMIDAAERGIPAIGGLTMLVGQAAASSAIFTGREVKNAQEVLQNLRRKTENIILVGMPGSGKTTLGSSVALQLGKKFVDTDEEIIRDAGRSISEIFAAEGEAGFRARESAVTARVGKESGLVIATGGGCVTRDENYRSLHQNGTIIFIERDVSTLERCGRPLSQGDLAALYETRLPMYRRFADFTVDANCRPDMTARSIVEILM